MPDSTSTTNRVPTLRGAVDFDRIYAEASGDASRIPWTRGGPDPGLIAWLDSEASSSLRAGCRAIVPGCGLGDDARELLRRGFDVTAFDFSGEAIAWAKRLDPTISDRFVEADLFSPRPGWLRRFDLVADCFCLQSMPATRHEAAMAALANLLAPRGVLVVCGRCGERPAAEVEGPPWPVMPQELEALARRAGLLPLAPVATGIEGGRLRGVFSRR
ncbi:MAG: class I SAM-dependent methyltransferase [Phycisphaerales bacterium]